MTRDPNLPLGGLPAADHTLLVEPPLELAVAEIRFLGEQQRLDVRTGLAIRDLLDGAGYHFDRLEPVREGHVAIDLEQGAVPTLRQDHVTGWQFTDARGQLQLTAMPNALVVQTTKYERWSSSMRPLLAAALNAVEKTVTPPGTARIGLRYVDRFTDPTARDTSAWRGRICESLLGPLTHPVFGAKVRAAQQQVELDLEPAAGALLRHGPYADAAAAGAVSYLLDIDVFDTSARAFDVEDILDTAQVLNRTAFTLFQSSLTEDYLRRLGAKLSPEPGTDVDARVDTGSATQDTGSTNTTDTTDVQGQEGR